MLSEEKKLYVAEIGNGKGNWAVLGLHPNTHPHTYKCVGFTHARMCSMCGYVFGYVFQCGPRIIVEVSWVVKEGFVVHSIQPSISAHMA